MINQETAKKILQKINEAKNIFLVGHTDPDSDSIGASLALAGFLNSINKNNTVFALGCPSANLGFLNGGEKIVGDPAVISDFDFDLIFILDFSEFRRSGLEEKLNEAKDHGVFFINIDHHQTNDSDFDIKVAEAAASSTSELVYDFFKFNDIEITASMATALLAGIVGDTGNFTNGATTFSALKASADLLHCGGKIQEVMFNLWRDKNLPILRLWGKALLRLEENPETGITTTFITLKDLAEEGADKMAAEGVANFLNVLGEARAIMVLREEEGGFVRGSLRTIHDDMDVSKIARQYGGGGHKKAAGFKIPGHLIETEEGWKII